MPSTGDATLQLIQREISEVVQREKELRESYTRSESGNGASLPNGRPHFDRAKSVPPIVNGSSNGVRRFTPNPVTKGVMHRFIKSRGKIAAQGATQQQAPQTAWANLQANLQNVEFIESPKPVFPTGMQPRNGFVPVEERIKKEFQEMQERESELRLERQKSQPDLLACLESSPEPERRVLRSARSISQLSEIDYSDHEPFPLKSAKSLADLCVADEEEQQPPGSLTLIKQWENLIQKNQTHV